MTPTVGGGLSFGSQAGDVKSMARWELQDAQNRRKGTNQVTVNKVKRLLAKQGKDVPLL
jgi:hypothetical protein